MTEQKTIIDTWRTIAQPFECAWWRDAGARNAKYATTDQAVLGQIHAGLVASSAVLMTRCGFAQNQFAGKTCVEIGPGPTGRTQWLNGNWIAIEPLWNDLAALPWAQVRHFTRAYPQPAETPITELFGTVDFVACINCLDHCYDVAAVVRNIGMYLRPGGIAFVSVDVDKGSTYDPTHPIACTPLQIQQCLTEAGLAITGVEQGGCTLGADVRDNWGGGTAWHWWTRKD